MFFPDSQHDGVGSSPSRPDYFARKNLCISSSVMLNDFCLRQRRVRQNFFFPRVVYIYLFDAFSDWDTDRLLRLCATASFLPPDIYIPGTSVGDYSLYYAGGLA